MNSMEFKLFNVGAKTYGNKDDFDDDELDRYDSLKL